MKRSFLPEITYMRGLCMLGVIGIHVGSYALQNPFVNLQLISVLEILSRFAVPAFFFLSAFPFIFYGYTGVVLCAHAIMACDGAVDFESPHSMARHFICYPIRC